MDKLFIELYLDEDVNVLVADLIRARGFTSITTRDRLTYVTPNRADFEARALEFFASGKTHYGIIIAVRRPPQEVVRRLLVILNNVTADEMVN